MKELQTLKEFYSSLNSINLVNLNLDTKRDELKTIIETFDKDIQNKKVDKKLVEQNKQLGELLLQTIDKLKNSSSIWVSHFEKLLEREKFRSDLENYFIVIIFGKVNAGKSSLGNFIAKNNTTDNKPTFFKYDEAGNEQAIKKLQEIDENDAFDTNNLECTIEIQGFKLDGMAWIDTPGLGSMVEANGNLAKAYIQSADYIIYPTSSNAALTRDEIEQVQELFLQKKPVTICITKSDTLEKRKDGNGKYIKDENGKFAKFIVNKSVENREAQESYVKSEIEKILKDKSYKIGDIFSISAHTANEGIKQNDEELFVNSNIPKFYSLLTEVVKEKASILKSSSPFNGLVAFIDNELLGDKNTQSSINALKNTLKYFDSQILEAKERLKVIQSNTLNDVESEIDFLVSKYGTEFTKDNWKEKIEQIDQEIIKSIESIFSKNINEVLHKFSFSLGSLKNSLNNLDDFEVKDDYKEIEVRYVDNGITNLWGLFGDRYSYVSENIHIGDNKEEMLLNFKKNRVEVHTKYMMEQYQNISKSFFEALMDESKKIKQDIATLEKSIKNYKNNLKG